MDDAVVKLRIKAAAREIAITLLIALALFLGIRMTLQNVEVISGSMIPTMPVGERVLIYKLAYKFGHEPQRGDIIVFTPPEQLHSDTDYVKRVIGLPGETITIHSGKVTISKVDGTQITLEEPYVAEPPNYSFGPFTVPEGHYFVMGDNRNKSADSHNGWTVPRENIVGRAWLVIWPWSNFGSTHNYDFYKAGTGVK
ncbi:MAG: signal peptidase I [Dehalococcoidia bacterium]|nr:signal peptidase I [Dehalococcoidia bacterium]